MYDEVSSSYNAMMDTSCGSGYMLAMYHEQFDQTRSLIGVDLSPEMAAITGQ
ncbi:MAG: hypothetical protein HOH02_04785 [Oceanospirillaceae bacterium]|jgi:ubiquinone/menaquinone biosynthesis C-methylase UbiE|nr:hypothetical protein [Oceanospirillaceae bacterium]MBT6077261.1 hypothetical protein [Oceanospirillaceae bacterium]